MPRSCLNPNCANPLNPNGNGFCTTCGTKLGTQPIFRNRFKIISLLGQGNFGRTYQVEDLDNMNRLCVLKKLIYETNNPEQINQIQNLFQQEAEQLQQLGSHPQIPALYAYFTEENNLYLVQEFIAGQNLLNMLSEQGSFTQDQIIEILRNILPVLDFIHDRKVLHRDIKPENMMYSTQAIILPNKEIRRIVLIDFGAAKQTVGTITEESKRGTQIYTPGYAADEHQKGFPIYASDIYSLGISCIRLLTGEIPDFDSNLRQTIDNLYNPLENKIIWRPVVQQKGIELEPKLANLLDKMIKPIPKERYQKANEVLADLNKIFPLHKKKSYLTRRLLLLFAGGLGLSLGGGGLYYLSKMTSSGNNNIKLQTYSFQTVTVNNRGEKINEEPSSVQYFEEDINGVRLRMVKIPGGTFQMGSPDSESKRYFDEGPIRFVTVPDFYLGMYLITVAQWNAIVQLPKVNIDLVPEISSFKGFDNLPIDKLSWNLLQEFCARLAKLTQKRYRLPSEAEWEYAARARTLTPFHFGETITSDLANYRGTYTYAEEPIGTYRAKSTPVGQFPPNAFGLYDMHGNLWEWVQDEWHYNYYNDAPKDGSAWESKIPSEFAKRVLRGGSWYNLPVLCRSALRLGGRPDVRYTSAGGRIALSGNQIVSSRNNISNPYDLPRF